MNNEITPELVLHGYCVGVFPMGDDDGDIYWYSPDPRCVFEFDRFHIPHGLKPVLNRQAFEIRINCAFREVMQACADREGGTWITNEILDIYCEIHERGLAHSVEAWQDGQLAGGLYGVSIGGAFFGESMFHRVTDASKVALVALMRRLEEREYALVDTQWITPHLKRFGAIEIPRNEYLGRLEEALSLPCRFAG